MAYGFILPSDIVFQKDAPVVESSVPLLKVLVSGPAKYTQTAVLESYAAAFSVGLYQVSYLSLYGGAIRDFYVKHAGAFTSNVTPYVKLSGTYRQATAMLVRRNGAWVTVYGS